MTRSLPHKPLFLSAALAFAVVLLAASSAHAQRYERFRDEDDHYGPYFAAGLGGGVQLLNFDDGQLAGQGEVRFGFSFGRFIQAYLDADFSGSSHFGATLTASDILFGVRYFFYADRFVGVYGRVGIGMGIVSGLSNVYQDNLSNTEYGLAESGALGMELRLGGPGNKWAISPEFFYRRTNETEDSRVDTFGLAILINFN